MFTRAHYRCLQHGFKYFLDDGHYDGRSLWRNESLRVEMARAWQFLRPQLLAEWITLPTRAGDHGGPGTRPAGWWVYDAKQRRQRIDGKPHPFDNPERQAKIAAVLAQYPQRAPDFDYLFYGLPCPLVIPDDFAAAFETEFDYLNRLGLLLPGEVELYAEMQRREAERKKREEEQRRLEDMGL